MGVVGPKSTSPRWSTSLTRHGTDNHFCPVIPGDSIPTQYFGVSLGVETTGGALARNASSCVDLLHELVFLVCPVIKRRVLIHQRIQI